MIKLPFQINPALKTYQLKAFELGIIEANEESVRPWLFNRYINQLYMVKDRRFTYTNYDRWHAKENVTRCQKLCVDVNQIINSNSGINIIGLICEMLKNGNYVYGKYNEFYIPGKAQFQKKYFYHDFILFGFDCDKQVFYSAGYLSDGYYQQFLIPMDSFVQSISSLKDHQLNFHFIKYKNGIVNKIDLKMIYEDLFDFLHSINRRSIVNKDKVFGVDCETVFVNYLDSLRNCSTHSPVDVRHSKLFLELKKLMYERLLYLSTNSIIDEDIAQKYRDVCTMQEIVHMLCLKFNVNHDKDILTRIQTTQLDIIKMQKELLNQCLKCMAHYGTA